MSQEPLTHPENAVAAPATPETPVFPLRRHPVHWRRRNEPPQCDLPMEVVCNIFDLCELHVRDVREKLCPWTIKGGSTPLCSRACFRGVHLPVL